MSSWGASLSAPHFKKDTLHNILVLEVERLEIRNQFDNLRTFGDIQKNGAVAQLDRATAF